MMLDVRYKLDGVKKSQQAFERLDHKVRKGITRKSINASIRPTVKAMRKMAPRQTGLFRRSLTHRVKGYRQGAIFVAVAGQRSSGTSKAFDKAADKARSNPNRGGLSGQGKVVPMHLVIGKIKPHEVAHRQRELSTFTGRDLGSLVFKRYGRLNFLKAVNHPGHAGLQFMSRAARQTMAQNIAQFKKKFGDGVNAAVTTPASPGGK